jgi:hypothetical protein
MPACGAFRSNRVKGRPALGKIYLSTEPSSKQKTLSIVLSLEKGGSSEYYFPIKDNYEINVNRYVR